METHKKPSWLETIDPFNPGTIKTNAEEIGSKGATAGSTAAGLVAGHKGEEVGEELGNKAKSALVEPIAKALGELVKGYGLRLGEILAGAALILFGLATVAKGGTPPKVPRPL
jgi:hypothetical protein